MTRPRLALLPVLLLLWPLAGCATDDVQVSRTFDPLTAFPAEATYAWDESANQLPQDPRLQPMNLGPVLEETANEAFGARGYRVVTSGEPDYFLSHQLTVHNWYGPDNTRSIGSLSLLLVDAESSRRVWMGFARAEVHVGLSEEERRARLLETLDRMLEDFPPAQRGAQ